MCSPLAGSVGAMSVRELDWSVPAHREGVGPYDFVLAADCV